MPAIHREIALTLYRWATGKIRSQLARSFNQLGTYPASIVFYHRVADSHPNDWSINVQNFEQHLNWIAANANPVSLDDIRDSQILGRRTSRMVGITFDDGYHDNCIFAIPKLLERKIPVTYFVSTHFVETGEPFPHDTAIGLNLKPNTVEDIREMANQGVQIGAHSHSHVDFGRPLSKGQLKSEITDVRKRLQDWTGQSIDYFAFPYGFKHNISQEAVDVVFESGFKSFVSACGGVNWPGQDANHLQRVHGDPGIAALKNWLTFDPRKIYKKSPIQYSMPVRIEANETSTSACDLATTSSQA